MLQREQNNIKIILSLNVCYTFHLSPYTATMGKIHYQGVLGRRYVTLDTVAILIKPTSGEEAWPLMDTERTGVSQES